MSSTTQNRVRTMSSSNVEHADFTKLEGVEKANQVKNSKKGKAAVKKQLATTNVRRIAWDQLFLEGDIVNATKSFMDKLRRAVSADEYKTIIHEIEKTMDDEKDNHCKCSYSSLTETRNGIYSLYTDSLREEEGLTITNNINSLKFERGQVKTKMSDIEYNRKSLQ